MYTGPLNSRDRPATSFATSVSGRPQNEQRIQLSYARPGQSAQLYVTSSRFVSHPFEDPTITVEHATVQPVEIVTN